MTKEEIIRKIRSNRSLMNRFGVRSISLFGSYVRNEQRETSDVDLLVEFKAPSYDNYINLIFSLEDLLKKEVTVVTPDGISPYVRPYVLKEAEKIEG
jgi:predicted nucleotidyltransferase